MDVLYSQDIEGLNSLVYILALWLAELIMRSSSPIQEEFCGHKRYAALVGKLALFEQR